MTTGLERLTEAHELTGIFISEDANKPLALAELFVRMFADEQAEFLHQVYLLSEAWKAPACFQWRAMEGHITPQARELLKAMYDHTEHSNG